MGAKLAWTVLLFVTAAPAFAQSPASVPRQGSDAVPAQAEIIPERTLKFTPVDSGSNFAISPLTSLPQCDTEGYLFLDILDPKDLDKHTVVSFPGKESRTYSPSAISDLHDIFFSDFYASSSEGGFMVRGSKEQPGPPGPGKSPAGIAWSSYHNYVAVFNRDGSYKESIELPLSYHLSHLAIFPSGEFLVAGYDQLNSAVRLLLRNSSGEISKTIDLPGSRAQAAGNAPYHSIEAAQATRKLMGSIGYRETHLSAWRARVTEVTLPTKWTTIINSLY